MGGRGHSSRWVRTHEKMALQALCRRLFWRWGGGIAIPIKAQAAGLTRQFRAFRALASCDPLAWWKGVAMPVRSTQPVQGFLGSEACRCRPDCHSAQPVLAIQVGISPVEISLI